MGPDLKNVKILLGVTGGIAAYKSAELCRHLVKSGARVQVIMSDAACRFITPLTMETLSGQPVHVQMFDPARRPLTHIEAPAEADILLVAPATADYLARCATGRASDLISAVTLAFAGPVLAAPAMNTNMWRNPATVRNLHTLRDEHGWHIVAPGSGELACGTVGEGRLADTDDILRALTGLLRKDLNGLRILVTAGPTVEDLDPVRFISNRSSGRTGYAIAAMAARRGADVTLVSGPVSLPAPPRVTRVPVRSALEMEQAVLGRAADMDVIVMASAVADYRPETSAPQKIKKGTDDTMTVKLVKNPDILLALGRLRGTSDRPVVAGFALETEHLVENAQKKRAQKNAHIIVANLAQDALDGDTTRAVIVDDTGETDTGGVSKEALADRLLDICAARCGRSR